MPYNFTVNPSNEGGRPDLRNGVYDFTIDDIRPAEASNAKYDKGLPRAEFVLALDQLDEDGDAVIVRDWITIYPEPKRASKLYQLISAVLYDGGKVPKNGGVSASQLLNRRGQLIWGDRELSESKGVTGYLPPKSK